MSSSNPALNASSSSSSSSLINSLSRIFMKFFTPLLSTPLLLNSAVPSNYNLLVFSGGVSSSLLCSENKARLPSGPMIYLVMLGFSLGGCGRSTFTAVEAFYFRIPVFRSFISAFTVFSIIPWISTSLGGWIYWSISLISSKHGFKSTFTFISGFTTTSLTSSSFTFDDFSKLLSY